MVVAEILTGIALVKKSVDFIKENISTVQDIQGIAKQIDGFFLGEEQMNKRQGKGMSIMEQFGSVESSATDYIDRKLLEEKRQELKQLINLRFGPQAWDQIIAERADRIAKAKEAQRQEVDPALAIAVAYHETRFENITSHKGAQGPLGVLPQYHCPKKGKCDYTKAGILALKKFLNINHQKKCTALAQYNRGLKGKCKQGRSEHKYAQAVLDTFNEIVFFNQESCFDKPIK